MRNHVRVLVRVTCGFFLDKRTHRGLFHVNNQLVLGRVASHFDQARLDEPLGQPEQRPARRGVAPDTWARFDVDGFLQGLPADQVRRTDDAGRAVHAPPQGYVQGDAGMRDACQRVKFLFRKDDGGHGQGISRNVTKDAKAAPNANPRTPAPKQARCISAWLHHIARGFMRFSPYKSPCPPTRPGRGVAGHTS